MISPRVWYRVRLEGSSYSAAAVKPSDHGKSKRGGSNRAEARRKDYKDSKSVSASSMDDTTTTAEGGPDAEQSNPVGGGGGSGREGGGRGGESKATRRGSNSPSNVHITVPEGDISRGTVNGVQAQAEAAESVQQEQEQRQLHNDGRNPQDGDLVRNEVDSWFASEVDPFLGALREGLLKSRPTDVGSYASDFAARWGKGAYFGRIYPNICDGNSIKNKGCGAQPIR